MPTQHRWPSDGDWLEALAKGDRLFLLRLQLLPRGDLLNWRLPTDASTGAPVSGPVEIVWREQRRQALPPRFGSGHAAVPMVVIDAHDGLVLRSWQAKPNPGAVDGYDVVPVGEPERMPQRFDLPHLGLAHHCLNHYCCRSDYEDLLSRTAPIPVGTPLLVQLIAQVLIHEEALDHRCRLGQSGGFNHRLVVAAHLAEFVHDHRHLEAVLIGEDPVAQGGVAGTERTREHGDRQMLGGRNSTGEGHGWGEQGGSPRVRMVFVPATALVSADGFHDSPPQAAAPAPVAPAGRRRAERPGAASAVRDARQGMGLATVYRGLKLQQQAGLVRCRKLSSGETVYAPLERDDHHLTCVQCGSRQSLPLCPLGAGSLGLNAALLQGFRPLFHTFEIHGLCSRCQQVEVGLDG